MMPNRKWVIFDVDGTLADNTHRQHFLKQSPKRWDDFFDSMGLDEPIAPIVELCKNLGASEDYKIAIFTARPERYRAKTKNWLSEQGISYHKLVMRINGDYRDDKVAKREMLEKLGVEIAEIAFVVDDRNKVVAMWRELGITCLQCAEHDF